VVAKMDDDPYNSCYFMINGGIRFCCLAFVSFI